MSRRLAIFPGSFDPVTNGHVDLIARAAALFDEVVVAIGRHPSRQPLFTLDERMDLLRAVTGELGRVRVDAYDGLLADFAVSLGAVAIVRGIRNSSDFEYELPIAQANRSMRPELDTLFLATQPQHGFVSASIVREIASHGGDRKSVV